MFTKPNRSDKLNTRTTGNVAVRLEGVSKEYVVGDVIVRALNNVDLEIREGEFVVILGPSGSGKTTLLNVIGGLDTVTRGTVWVGDQEITDLNERQMTNHRRNRTGFVFQFFNLVPTLTARENVEMIAELVGNKDRVDDALRSVGLEDRASHFPGQLLGGEQQRVAIARAIAKGAPLLLCDEPTGELDFETGKMVLSALRELNQADGKTFLVITHNTSIGKMADRVIRIRSGEIDEDVLITDPISPEELEW